MAISISYWKKMPAHFCDVFWTMANTKEEMKLAQEPQKNNSMIEHSPITATDANSEV